MKRNGMGILLLVLAACALGLVVAVEQLLPVTAVRPYRLRARPWDFTGRRNSAWVPAGKAFSVCTPDGLELKAVSVEPVGTPVGTLILLHGRSNNKESRLEQARLLAAEGWRCIALDLRAHGESEGRYCTYGHYEKYDILALLDTIQSPGPVGIWGRSLGGAVALQAMELDSRLSFGIIESTFDELHNVVMEYGADYMFGWRSKWLTSKILQKGSKLAGFDAQAIRPVDAAACIDRPLLFIHGTEDDKIPPDFNRRNFEAAPATDKKWIEVQGADHFNLWHVGGKNLQNSILSFLSRQGV